jgi:predicted hydrocarbon binding protein
MSKFEVGLASEDRGILRTSPTNARVILLSCSGYRAMCDLLYEQFQSGAGTILYRMGEGYARKLVSSMPMDEITHEDAFKAFQNLALLAGWGRMNLKILDEKTAECLADDSPFVLYRSDGGHTSCFFLSGVLSGIASAMFKCNFKAVELACKTSRAPLCKFMIKQEGNSE